ncbi:hypothetical protein V865_008667 [Kwoniella europaea PYCC6329]|uniref:histidine kinase n=1 Tax=Kwoniella europaea PYCC6329 TaxID=1423913 RepID=A0AAX4KVZ3_9TREE
MPSLPLMEDSQAAESEQSEPSIRVQEWTSFLTSYAQGDWSPDRVPPKPTPAQDLDIVGLDKSPSVDSLKDDSLANVYSSPIISRKIARRVRQYCWENDYLPPPRSPHEEHREKIILEYDLLGAVQAGNIQSAVDLIAAFFPGTVVTFTLFNNAIQNFVSIAGPENLLDTFQLKNGMWVAPETSLCGHSILLDEEIMFVPSLSDDWRFRSNPYAVAGLKSYIGSAVSLEMDPLIPISHRDGQRDRVGIGVLNILFMYDPLYNMTTQQEMVVRNISKMLETQLRATWQGHITTKEAKVRRAITDIIEEGFVGNQSASLQSVKDVVGPQSGVISGGGSLTMFEDLVDSALNRLLGLMSEVDALCMIDIRSIRIQSQPNSKPEYHIDPSSPHPVSTIALAPRHGFKWPLLPSTSALLSYLNRSHSLFTFTQSSLSGLESELPPSTKSHLVMPFFTLDQPSFIIMAISKHNIIHSDSVNITRSVGSVLLAKAIQSRVMEADAAKTAFLSSISHELRTPMHSVMSGLQLVQSSVDAKEWDNTRPLLDVVQTSGHTLQRILDDVIDFDPAYNSKNKVSRGVTVDLLKLAKDAVRICLARSDDMELGSTVHIEHQERDWVATIDEARYNRIIFNGLTNAMKFCKNGSISVSLSTSEDSTKLVTRITDNGIGIDDKVLPRLLEPFTKQDLHSPGAGLGLYITKNLVNSMGGTFAIQSTLGQGTTFEVILPIYFDKSLSSSNPPSVKRILQYTGMDSKGEGTISSPSSAAPSKSKKTTMEQKSGTNALRVMVVDDNRICRLLLLKSIQKGSTPVQTAQAADGQQAVEMFRTFQPDLVITDVSMPVMGGITAAQEMRRVSQEMNFPPCKIYALTGLGSSDPRLKSIGMEGTAALDGWLVKGQDDLKVIQGIVANVHEDVNQREEMSPEDLLKKVPIADISLAA